MDYEIEWSFDEGADLFFPRVTSSRRPRHVEIESNQIWGEGLPDDAFWTTYVEVKDTDLVLPRRAAFVAYGGELAYDVVFVVLFDGVASTLGEVRYSVRPDRGTPVSTTNLRTIPLERLMRRAVDENRIAYRRDGPGAVWRVDNDERETHFAPTMKRSANQSRRRISDDQLKTVAEVYRRAYADGSSPTKAVQEQLRLPNRNVAKKWVQRARDVGYLSPALGERRGGAS